MFRSPFQRGALAAGFAHKGEAPGPWSLPIFGDPGLFGTRNLVEYFREKWLVHGDVYRVNLLGLPTVVISHPSMIKEVLWTKRANYVKGPAYKSARRLLGDGLLTLEGEIWRERRTLAQPAFHRRSLQQLTEAMGASGARMLDQLAQDSRGRALAIDVHHEMMRLTMDVVVNALFGQALQESNVPYQTIRDALEVMSARGTESLCLHGFPHQTTGGSKKRSENSMTSSTASSDVGANVLCAMVRC